MAVQLIITIIIRSSSITLQQELDLALDLDLDPESESELQDHHRLMGLVHLQL